MLIWASRILIILILLLLIIKLCHRTTNLSPPNCIREFFFVKGWFFREKIYGDRGKGPAARVRVITSSDIHPTHTTKNRSHSPCTPPGDQLEPLASGTCALLTQDSAELTGLPALRSSLWGREPADLKKTKAHKWEMRLRQKWTMLLHNVLLPVPWN